MISFTTQFYQMLSSPVFVSSGWDEHIFSIKTFRNYISFNVNMVALKLLNLTLSRAIPCQSIPNLVRNKQREFKVNEMSIEIQRSD